MSARLVVSEVILGPGLAGTLMTPEEFDAVEEYDDDYRYELIHGVLGAQPLLPDVIVGENETYRTAFLPGSELPLARLLAEADAWERSE